MIRHPPRSPLFPYTTLSRSLPPPQDVHQEGRQTLDHADVPGDRRDRQRRPALRRDRKSTRLNSSHLVISYAVFCLKKKKKKVIDDERDMYTQPCLRRTTEDL